jgi:hypothetical protein
MSTVVMGSQRMEFLRSTTMKSIGIDYLSAPQIVCPTLAVLLSSPSPCALNPAGSTIDAMLLYAYIRGPLQLWIASRASGFRRHIVTGSEMYLTETPAVLQARL